MNAIMNDSASLLIELGTEELPPKALDGLAHAFREGVHSGLAKLGIAIEGESRALWSPRRLVVLVPKIGLRQPDQPQERRGPALSAAFDAQGRPSKALLGFAQSCGVAVDQLVKLETDKGAWFMHRSVQPGQPTANLLSGVINDALKALPIPRPMRWSDQEQYFVRPVHWLVVLLGDQVVDAEALGLKSGRNSCGHRFMHPGPVPIGDAASYIRTLREAKVLVDPNERRDAIEDQVLKIANGFGLTANLRMELLEEVKNLVEWPVAIHCEFDRDFLQVPQEALIKTMEDNQRFFPMVDKQGRLTEHFIGIANIASKDPAEIKKGYERVIRPRFADAKFFVDADLKESLDENNFALGEITYQSKLGTVLNKVERIERLAQYVASLSGAEVDAASTAANLCKSDLTTRMVGEFPELQGTIGKYYALQKGVASNIAAAIEEHYWPRFAGDKIPQGSLGLAVSIADRIDTLVGFFMIDQKPTGNKDPFSLRRQALGLVRCLVEGKIDLDLEQLIQRAMAAYAKQLGLEGDSEALIAELYQFITERLRGYCVEQRGVKTDAFNAVLAVRPTNLLDFMARLEAVAAFAALPDAANLAAANKRIANILKQAPETSSSGIQDRLLGSEEEKRLFAELHGLQSAVGSFVAQRRYVDALRQLAGLREPVDAFFDKVMVMVDDSLLRQNRLLLLRQVRDLFMSIADVSLLQGTATKAA